MENIITFHQVGHYLIREDKSPDGVVHYSVKNIIADEMYEELQYGWAPVLDEQNRIPESIDDVVKTIYHKR